MEQTAVRKGKGKKIAFRTLTHVVLILCSLTMLIPFLWMISSSLKNMDELFAVPPYWIPKDVAWENYVYMFEQAPWVTYFVNTAVITVVTILGQLITCSLAAYAFARLRFKGRNLIFIIYLGTMMIPFQVVMIPQFQIIKVLGLIDNIWSLIVIGIFNAFGTFLLRQFFLTLPRELEEAAMIDGCSPLQTFFRIVLPVMKPMCITVAILQAMWIWNDYLLPYLVLDLKKYKTIPIAIQYLRGGYGSVDMGAMMGVLVLAIIPIVIFYILCQKYIIEGVLAGAVKG